MWYEAGVKYIKDLITEDGNFMAFSVFQHIFRTKTHFLQFLGLLNAIATSWKKKLSYKEDETNDCEINNILTKKCFEKPTSVVKLEKASFSADEILHINELPFKQTLDIRMSAFQFKINHSTFCTRKVDSLVMR